MKRILFILALLFSVGILSCQSQDYIGWVGCNSAPTALITTSTPEYSNIYVGYTITTGCPTAYSQGLCWNTTGNPTTSDSTLPTDVASGADNITGLSSNTTYYIRVYIISALGTFYSAEISRTTLSSITIPTVTTSTPSNLYYNKVTLGGNVTSDGGGTVTERGVCFNTTGSPTISDFTSPNGSGIGIFSGETSGHACGIAYYVRAYATNSAGTGYGGQVTFNLNPSTDPYVDFYYNVQSSCGDYNLGSSNTLATAESVCATLKSIDAGTCTLISKSWETNRCNSISIGGLAYSTYYTDCAGAFVSVYRVVKVSGIWYVVHFNSSGIIDYSASC